MIAPLIHSSTCAQMPTINRIDHVQITIPRGSEDQARTFYCGVLGLQEIAKPVELQARGGLWIQLADTQLHIGTEDGIERGATKAHIAYVVDDIAAWRSALERAGIPITSSIELPGIERFEFRDPFGNRIEFTAPA